MRGGANSEEDPLPDSPPRHAFTLLQVRRRPLVSVLGAIGALALAKPAFAGEITDGWDVQGYPGWYGSDSAACAAAASIAAPFNSSCTLLSTEAVTPFHNGFSAVCHLYCTPPNGTGFKWDHNSRLFCHTNSGAGPTRGMCVCPPGSAWNPDGQNGAGGCDATCPTGASPRFATCTKPGDDPQNNGESCPSCGNPINPAAGVKYQAEPIYRSPTDFGLTFNAVYNSRSLTQVLRPLALPWTGNLGGTWMTSFMRPLVVVQMSGATPASVAVQRPDGKVFEFRAPVSGNEYLHDANISDRLTRLVDGGGATIGWRFHAAGTDEEELFDAAGSFMATFDRRGLTRRFAYADGLGGFYYGAASSVAQTAGSPFPPGYVAPDTCNEPASFAHQLDGAGNAVVNAPAGRLLCAVDPFGRSLNFQYDAAGRLVRMADPAGGLTTFEYDGATAVRRNVTDPAPGVVTKITFPDGASRAYHYNEPTLINGGAACAGLAAGLPSQLTGITDENGVRFATWRYDCAGRATSSEHAGGVERSTLAYDSPASGQTTITENLGDPLAPTSNSRVYAFASHFGKLKSTSIVDTVSGQPASCKDCGRSSATTYDSNGNAKSFVDWKGTKTCVAYDLARNLEVNRIEGLPGGADCDALLGASTPVLPVGARRVATKWSTDWRLPEQITQPGRKTTFQYGAPNDPLAGRRGQLLIKSVFATSDTNGAKGLAGTTVGAAIPLSFDYDAHGRLVSADGPRTDVSDVTTLAYYAANDADLGKRGNLASVTDALGHTTQVSAYNAHGQALSIVDPNGRTTVLTYDARQRLTSSAVGGELSAFAYDDVGQLVEVALPDGSHVSYAYDDAHRLVSVTDNLGNHVDYTLDLAGNRVKEQIYDASNTLNIEKRRGYDALNRLVSELGSAGQKTSYTLDGEGNVTAVTDPLGRTTTATYDALNRAVALTMPKPDASAAAPAVNKGYDGRDNVGSVADARGLTTTYTLDAFDRVRTTASPDAGLATRTYDAAGNLLSFTDAKGRITSMTYDAADRLKTVVYEGAVGTALKTVTLGYDQGANGIGRLTSITESGANTAVLTSVTYAYDLMGRVTKETREQGVTFHTSYEYAPTTGLLSRVTYPSGRSIAYTYDALGRIRGVETKAPAADGGGVETLVANASYEPFGPVKAFTLGNGQAVNRPHDKDGRIASFTLGAAQISVTYDDASRITKLVDQAKPASALTYGYDDLDRLVQATVASGDWSYAYDLNGNRTKRTHGAAVDNYSIDASSNRLLAIATAAATTSMTYDETGSLVTMGKNTFAFDERGRLVGSEVDGVKVAFQVDAQGRRVRKTGKSDRIFVYDTRGRLIAELTAAGLTKREYVHMGELLVAVVDS